jgi:prephenate dehydratase
MFYVDFAGHSSDQECANALDNLGEFAPFLRTLGSYPRHHLQGVFEESEN